MLNNKVNIEWFIRTIRARIVHPRFNGGEAMFLFNRSGLAVCLALVVAGLPVLFQLV
jgi:hypothetical protein